MNIVLTEADIAKLKTVRAFLEGPTVSFEPSMPEMLETLLASMKAHGAIIGGILRESLEK